MDRALCTIFGTKAVELIAEERFGGRPKDLEDIRLLEALRREQG